MNKKLLSGIAIIVLANLISIIIACAICDNSQSEEKRAEKSLSSHGYSLDDIEQFVFEYNAEYTMDDESVKSINSREVYCYDGKKFILVSDFLKGR